MTPAELLRFRLAMDMCGDAIYLVDRASMRFVDVNRTACERMGYGRDELLRMGPQDLLAIGREEIERLYDEAIAAGAAGTTTESTARRKDGSKTTTELHRRALRTDEGWIIVSIARDITARKRSEQLLKLEHSVTRVLADASDVPGALKAVMRAVCEIENWECGRYFRVNRAAGLLRFAEAWCVDDPPVRAFVEASRGIVFQRGQGLIGTSWKTGQPVWSADTGTDPRVWLRLLPHSGGTHGSVIFPVFVDGEPAGVFAFSSAQVREPDQRLLDAFRVIGAQIGQFIQRKRAEQASRANAEELRLFADNVPAMAVSWDADLLCRFVNRSYVQFFGTTAQKMAGQHLRETVGEAVYREIEGYFAQALQGNPVSYQRIHRPPHGEPRALEVRVLPNVDEQDRVVGLFSVILDVTEYKQTEERIQRVAHHDGLTGLPNRLLFSDRLQQAIALSKRDARQFALLYLDLDHFKPVNDSLGHAAGDELLAEVAARLRRQVRESDTVARMGGDEFTVILVNISGREGAEVAARKIADALAAPVELASRGQRVTIGASIGVVLYPADAQDADGLLKAADAAMYRVKQAR